MPTHGINLVESSPLWLSSADAGSRSEGPCEEARRVVEWWVLAHRTGAWRGQGGGPVGMGSRQPAVLHPVCYNQNREKQQTPASLEPYYLLRS